MKGSIRISGLFCLAVLAAPLTASAQSYPFKPITVVVPFPAGGPSDVVARIITENMCEDAPMPPCACFTLSPLAFR